MYQVGGFPASLIVCETFTYWDRNRFSQMPQNRFSRGSPYPDTPCRISHSGIDSLNGRIFKNNLLSEDMPTAWKIAAFPWSCIKVVGGLLSGHQQGLPWCIRSLFLVTGRGSRISNIRLHKRHDRLHQEIAIQVAGKDRGIRWLGKRLMFKLTGQDA